MRRFGPLFVLKLNPRNFRSTGRATASWLVYLEVQSGASGNELTLVSLLPCLSAADVNVGSPPHTVRSDACAVRVAVRVRQARCSIEAERVVHLAAFLFRRTPQPVRSRVNCFTLRHDSVTCSRSPEVSSTTFPRMTAGFTTSALLDMSFAVSGRSLAP